MREGGSWWAEDGKNLILRFPPSALNKKTAVSLATAAANVPVLVRNCDGGVALRNGWKPAVLKHEPLVVSTHAVCLGTSV